jgi:hypothetical protein
MGEKGVVIKSLLINDIKMQKDRENHKVQENI